MSEINSFRSNVLTTHGATSAEADELLAYNQNMFDHTGLKLPLDPPLPDEPFVATWHSYAAEAEERQDVFACLQDRLVQLRFPIQAGISQTEAYRSATRKGTPADGMAAATGLHLNAPDQLRLLLHQTPAGRIPLLITGNKQDFVSLVQAFFHHNEPVPIPDSMGAAIVSGLNNWDRIRQYRQAWEEENRRANIAGNWAEEFRRLIPCKELYQDRLIILSDGPYSDVPAADMGLSETEWRRVSLAIRCDHEGAHYFTRRVFASMRNNLIDELIADYIGIVAAVGHFRADWFLRFMGLESFPTYRRGGRLQNYRGRPPLSDGAFTVLGALVRSAAENLERFDADYASQLKDRALMLIALTYLTLEEIASNEAERRLQQVLSRVTTPRSRSGQ